MENNIKNLFDDAFRSYRLRRIDNPGLLESKYVYDNQLEASKEIIYNFFTGKRWSLLLAEMQSGKSGAFFSIPYIINENRTLVKKLNIDIFDGIINVWLLTGMMETELTNQFKGDIDSYTGMGEEIKSHVLDNNLLQKYLKNYQSNTLSYDEKRNIERMRKNSLILIDESHYGSNKKSSLDKFLKEIINISPNGENEFLVEKNIYIVSISATPMAETLESSKKELVILKNSYSYYGISEMFKLNKIHDSYDLKDSKSINLMLDYINKINKIGFIIIRTTKSGIDKILIEINKKITDIDPNPIYYDSKHKDTIDSILSRDINKKTIIFIKGKLRAGKQLKNKNKVIMIHDTANSNVDTTVQSLLGRFCGYNSNKDVEIFCDKFSAEKYKNWVENGFILNKVPDKSKNVLSNRDKNLRIETLHHSKLFDVSNNFDIDCIMNKSRKTKEDKIKVLELINDDDINKIIKDKILSIHYDIGSIFKVDQNKKNSSYKKQYEDVIKSGNFMGDIKEDKIREGQIIFSAAYEINTKNIVVSFGKVVESKTQTSEKSMYHESNKLSLLAQVDLENK